jgi:hypothetical protein
MATRIRWSEPRGLLCYADRAMNFVTADPILAIGDHPDSSEPLVQPERAVLKDGADLG